MGLGPPCKELVLADFSKGFPMGSRQPTTDGVRAAAKRIAEAVTKTPLLPLDWRGRRLWVKAECLQQSGSFKLPLCCRHSGFTQ